MLKRCGWEQTVLLQTSRHHRQATPARQPAFLCFPGLDAKVCGRIHTVACFALHLGTCSVLGTAGVRHNLLQKQALHISNAGCVSCLNWVRQSHNQCVAIMRRAISLSTTSRLSEACSSSCQLIASLHLSIATMQDLMSELQAGSPSKENQPAMQQFVAASSSAAAPAATRAGSNKPALAPSRQNAKHNSAANRQAAMRQQMEV